MSCFKVKQSGAVLDYVQDWTDWLAGDTISSSDWAVTGGLVVDSDTNTTTTTTVWLSGGTFGATAEATNTIVTAGGRTGKQVLTVRVV